MKSELIINVQIHYFPNISQIIPFTVLTMVVCLVLLLYYKQNRFPITLHYEMFLSVVTVGIGAGIIALCCERVYYIIFPASFFALIFSQYFIFEMQLMLEGQHIRSIDPEEPIFAVLSMHLHIFAFAVFAAKRLWSEIRPEPSAVQSFNKPARCYETY